MSEIPSHSRPTKLDATVILGSITESAEYQQNFEVGGHNSKRALARAALELAGMESARDNEDLYEPDSQEASRETSIYAVVGTMSSYVYGLEGIRYKNSGGDMDYHEYRSMKGRAARFNHAIKSLIEQDRSLNFTNVSSVVMEIFDSQNRDRWGDDDAGYTEERKWFKQHFEGALRGMQHEVLAHQIINAINEVDPVLDAKTQPSYPCVVVDPHVSVEDDLKGADLYITLEGVTFPIDIKASERTANNTRAKSSHPKAIITTGIASIDLNNQFRVNKKRAQAAAPSMLEKLYAARAEFLAKKKQSVRPPRKELTLAA